ncbi:MAG: hypothetical protein LBP75_01760 [Planctomycetota bacterium]|jgi:hypothetical protein|nr:hypothetical protein [Planctomycetota bacterium]
MINLAQYPRFAPPTREQSLLCARRLIAYVRDFAQSINACLPLIDADRLNELIVRVEQRRVYFHVFHPEMKMGELNEFVLYTFWILKLCPFRLPGDFDPGLFNRDLAFAIFTRAVFNEAIKREKKTHLTRAIIDKLLYDFRYRDLSKEAMMTLAETLII